MYKVFSLGLFFLFQTRVWCQLFVDGINYTTPIINLESLVYCDDEPSEGGTPYREHILIAERSKFIRTCISNAGEKDRPVYRSSDGSLMSFQDVRKEYTSIDTIVNDGTEWGYQIVISETDLVQGVKKLDFTEKWSFDKQLIFSKSVNQYAPVLPGYDRNTGVELGEKKICIMKGNWQKFKASGITPLIRYRVIIADTSLYPSAELDKIPITNRQAWWNQLVNGIKNNKVVAYDSFDPSYALNKNEIDFLSGTVDSIKQTRPYPPYDLYDTVYVTSNFQSFVAIDFFESWSFNATGNIEKEVLAYQPVISVRNPMDQSFLGFKPLFLIYNGKKGKQKLTDLNFLY